MIRDFTIEDDDAADGVALARFEARVGEVILRNMMVRRNDDGGLKMVAPSAFGEPTFLVRPQLWRAIEREAIALYEAAAPACAGPVILAAG